MTTPVALTAIENTPSDCAVEMASATASSSLLSPVTAAHLATELRDQFTRPLHVWIEDHRCCTSRNEPADGRAAEPTRAPCDDARSAIELHHRAPSIRATIAEGVNGRQVISMPNGDSASAIAFITAGGAPIAPPSPTPLKPPGPGPGSRRVRTRSSGTSAAVGRR